PKRHIDVGSRIDGFVAHVAAFRKIEVLDIRPQSQKIKNMSFHQADLMSELPAKWIGNSDSLSCLHALEHFGLGRYGDPIDPMGHFKGLRNLLQIVKKGGRLYLSVPIGPQRIEFNAHRVFSVSWILRQIEKNARCERFSYVDDLGDLHEGVDLDHKNQESSFGCHFGCGIFEFIKK
ncbi:MAG: DUF268 domain-containing protein, partial [Spirochaetia bacterium]|nr:DUF268 domain-containing protein [Spirochaetia bacterium]